MLSSVIPVIPFADHVISASAAKSFAVNITSPSAVPSNSTVVLSAEILGSFTSGVPVLLLSLGFSIGVVTSSPFSSVPEFADSILPISPVPVTLEPAAVEVDVTVSTFASGATSTFAVALSAISTFSTFAVSFISTFAAALSLTATFPTVALSFTSTPALAFPLTATFFTSAFPFTSIFALALSFTSIFSTLAPLSTVTSVLPSPFNTMSVALPVTLTLSTPSAVSATSSAASSPNSTVLTLAPSATSTGAVASALSIVKFLIAVATLAIILAGNLLGVCVVMTT